MEGCLPGESVGGKVVGFSYGLVKCYPVAGDVSHSYRGLVGCFSEKVEKELGVLVIHPE